MGFLKFLKRDKKQEQNLDFNNLDVPPMPPNASKTSNVKVKGEEFPDLPELPELDKLPELDEPTPGYQEKSFPELEMPSMPPLEPPSQVKRLKDVETQKPIEMPKPLFDMKKPERFMPPKKEEMPKHSPILKQDIDEPMPEFGKKFERAVIREEKNVLIHKDAKGPIYVRVDRFREILKSISTIKNDLKEGDAALVRMNEIDVNSDKRFEKWKNAMGDMQKKFIFIDNAIFKK